MSWKWQRGCNLCSLDSVWLLSEKASANGCPAQLLCYLWTANLQVQAAALNSAEYPPEGLVRSYAFFTGMIRVSYHTVDCSGVSVALVQPEED